MECIIDRHHPRPTDCFGRELQNELFHGGWVTRNHGRFGAIHSGNRHTAGVLRQRLYDERSRKVYHRHLAQSGGALHYPAAMHNQPYCLGKLQRT